jgi:uncharacterized membrane protein YozB (DUF420 family)
MSTSARVIPADARPAASSEVARSIYVFMAILFVVVAVTGFAPRSLAIVAGTRPIPPLIVHLHAGAMSLWLALLLAQTILMARGRPETHKALGMASFFVGPIMFVLMSALVIRGFVGLMNPDSVPPAEILGNAVAFQTFIMARAALLFGLFFAWAIAVRKSDSETHKRMMILATFVVIDAAIARVPWLPGAFLRDGGGQGAILTGYDLTHLYQLLLLVPVLLYEWMRFGRVHWTYLLGIGLFLTSALAAHFAWNSPAWSGMVAGLFGT